MSQSFAFYDQRASDAADAAQAATLDNVRERNLRAEKTWRALADQAKKVEGDRKKAAAVRQERLDREAAEAAETSEIAVVQQA
ncbi:hypothetical protein CP97_12940 [Aurantiacibacter atlanticus]|uniref:Uncharacterized protein n=1 Tax=Aurantiacibacter atlanticus TaxID=1648404 RepID=A0A0H4VIR6_9SPHN|nr:hypothetical protein [Aurantiacibacter atlanticus]AKQ42751.1 hypothetical protein CP97_12940 [Aurantiacibacter atlanticus]MDF1835385.1 hypothetical protein [Alteraurantiacibacter sp. bin_em_oilr2.035]